jgi:hypothetical protein
MGHARGRALTDLGRKYPADVAAALIAEGFGCPTCGRPDRARGAADPRALAAAKARARRSLARSHRAEFLALVAKYR